MFTKWKSEAFDEFNQKLIQQKQLEGENKLLRSKHHDIGEELKKLSKDIFIIEEKWNELMTLQVKKIREKNLNVGFIQAKFVCRIIITSYKILSGVN